MKFFITESKLNKVIFNYLNQHRFVKKEINDEIYFINNINDKYAQIIYHKNDGWCFIYHKLIDKISMFFSLQDFESELVIGEWVEDTLQMEVTTTSHSKTHFQLVVKNTL